jgi:hypothetical protein
VSTKFDLTQLWTAQILAHPSSADYKQGTIYLDIMELEFKDGVVIQFGTERADPNGPSLIDEWMNALEEVDRALGMNPIPEWLSSCM